MRVAMARPLAMLAAVVLVLQLASCDVCGRKSDIEIWHGTCEGADAELTVSSDCACQDGLPHGKGWLHLPGRTITQGEWKFGKKTGLVRHRTRSGMDIVGWYEDDLQNGMTRMRLSTGDVAGEYKHGALDGYGVTVDISGAEYAGTYSAGKRNGFGVHIHQFGDSYKGEFKESLYIGCGTFHRGGTLGFFTSKVVGATRSGLWTHCNKTEECPIEYIICRCDMNEATTGLAPDARFQQCAHDSESKAVMAAAAARDMKRQILEQFEEVVLPGPAEECDFGVLPPEALAEIPEPVIDQDYEDDVENGPTMMGEVSLMVLLMSIPNGVAGGLIILPRKFHVFVYLTAIMVFLCIVEIFVGVDYAWTQCGVMYHAFRTAYYMDEITFDHTEELIRRGYLGAAPLSKSEL